MKVIDDGSDSPMYQLSSADLEDFIRPAVSSIEFDESFYLRTYTDIAKCVSLGQIMSGHQHFVLSGYFEGRLPRYIEVDSGFYLSTYQDVSDGFNKGLIASPQAHFENYGFTEGRLPYKDFNLMWGKSTSWQKSAPRALKA